MRTGGADVKPRPVDPEGMAFEANPGTHVARPEHGQRLSRRRIALLLALMLVIPVLYSYVATMLRPSNLPLSVRSVEWVRSNHGAWLVNGVERVYYSWNAPAKGGPALRALPKV